MTGKELAPRSIVVALDASPQSLVALEAAAVLAALLKAELRGMFIEDVNLLRTAALPFTQTVTLSGHCRHLDAEQVQCELDRQSGIARRAIREAADRLQLSWSFAITRGVVTAELLKAAAAADLITLGRWGWSLRKPAHLGSTTRALLQESPSSVLLAGPERRLEGPFAVLYDGSIGAGRALNLAASLAAGTNAGLVVLLTGPLLTAGNDDIDGILEELSVRNARTRKVSQLTTSAVQQALQETGAGTFIAGSGGNIDASILEGLHCPALLVR